MTDDARWHVQRTTPDEARRHRETAYFEALYRGHTFADTAPPRFCLDYPDGTPDIINPRSTPDACPGCQARAKRFDAWRLTQ